MTDNYVTPDSKHNGNLCKGRSKRLKLATNINKNVLYLVIGLSNPFEEF